MAVKKRGLGRGLDALLGGKTGTQSSRDESGSGEAIAKSPEQTQSANEGLLRNIPVEFIKPGRYQPRLDMRQETLEELANSIRSQGVMQPIVVRPQGNNRYEIIAGERRWRATQIAGLDSIPALVREVKDDAAVAMALIENIQRENLNPMEEAMALKRLQDEFELTQQEVADAVGKSRVTVTNLMRLMNLNPDVRKCLEHGDLEMGHARALLALKDEQQTAAAKSVIGKGLSVRQTEALVRRLLAGKSTKHTGTQPDPDIKHLQDELAEKLGTQVLVQHSAKGKGRLIFKYNNLDQLDGILAHIK